MRTVQSTDGNPMVPSGIFDYSGPLTESLIAATSQSLRTRLAERQVDQGKARKIFSSYIELAYNILHYGVAETLRDGASHRYGSISLTVHQAVYTLLATNRVSHTAADYLMARLDEFKAMSTEQIRFEYRLRLSNMQYERQSESRIGAGLGLMTIARNAASPLEYRVRCDEPEDTCLFSIHTSI